MADEGKFCCEQMRAEATRVCETHPERAGCPDCIIVKSGSEFGIAVHDGGASWITIRFCPWCGSRLDRPRRSATVPRPLCLCPATSEYDDPCPRHGVLPIGVRGDDSDVAGTGGPASSPASTQADGRGDPQRANAPVPATEVVPPAATLDAKGVHPYCPFHGDVPDKCICNLPALTPQEEIRVWRDWAAKAMRTDLVPEDDDDDDLIDEDPGDDPFEGDYVQCSCTSKLVEKPADPQCGTCKGTGIDPEIPGEPCPCAVTEEDCDPDPHCDQCDGTGLRIWGL